MRAQNPLLFGAALVALGAAVLLVPPGSPQGPDSLTFSAPVVVDHMLLNIPLISRGGEPSIALAPNGNFYISAPFERVDLADPIEVLGASQGRVWKSPDQGATWQLLNDQEGCLTPSNCEGNIDTDIAVDPNGRVYLIDLTGEELPLTVSDDAGQSWTFLTNVASTAPENELDRQWIASVSANHVAFAWAHQDGDPRKVQFRQSYDGGSTYTAIKTLATQMTQFGPIAVSPNDQHYLIPYALGDSVAESTIQYLITCILTPNLQRISANCINLNPILNPGRLHMLVSHDQGSTWTDVDLNRDLRYGPGIVGTWSPTIVFPVVTFDDAGTAYYSWSEYNATYHANLYWSRSTDQGDTWTAPQCLTCDQNVPIGNSIFPAIAAGSSGRVAVAYYHTDTPLDPNHTPGLWYLTVAYSFDALSATPTWTFQRVSDLPVHVGPICPNGSACLASDGIGDRSLLEFFEMLVTPSGTLAIAYMDDALTQVIDGSGGIPKDLQIRFVKQTGGTSFRV